MRTAVRRVAMQASSRWRVAVVGSGPAGFYATDHLLKKDPDVHVDIFERLPVPFGLVRYGVAPDHQDVKNVTDRFTQIASNPRVNFIGNVHVGESGAQGAASVSLPKLMEHYDAVLLSYGSASNRQLGLAGEQLPGVHSAREFVEWYNGHPEAVDRRFNLSQCETVVLVGHGNVALDCARVLSKSISDLKKSDIAAHAVEELERSTVKQVILIGRRGPLHAAFTIKELRELSKLSGVATSLEAPDDAFGPAVLAAAAADRPRKRLVGLMQEIAQKSPAAPASCDVRIRFQCAPVSFLPGPSGHLAALKVQQTCLEGAPAAGQQAVAVPGAEVEIPCELALGAIGYRSVAVEGVPFDSARGVIPHQMGRVTGLPGAYAAGWVKRGPSGVILNNVSDAAETANALLEDRARGLIGGATGRDALYDELTRQGTPVVDFAGWLRMDAEERRQGQTRGKVREKLTSVSEMLRVACG